MGAYSREGFVERDCKISVKYTTQKLIYQTLDLYYAKKQAKSTCQSIAVFIFISDWDVNSRLYGNQHFQYIIINKSCV